MRSRLQKILSEVIFEISKIDIGDADVPLLGDETKFDSLDLVAIVVNFERRVREDLNVNITLTDEKAVSRTRSPFRTVGSLLDYTQSLLPEHPAHP
jgi:acyl carrier protein